MRQMANEDPAAPGLLASTLLAAAEAHAKSRPSSASSGLDVIDDLALNGGFRYGEVTSIAGASGSGKTLVGCHSMVSFQLGRGGSESAFARSAARRHGSDIDNKRTSLNRGHRILSRRLISNVVHLPRNCKPFAQQRKRRGRVC